VLDALEQAIHDRRPTHSGGLIHHNDRGSQYVSINYTERLAEAEERYYAMLDEQPMAA
jgi:putative transposase